MLRQLLRRARFRRRWGFDPPPPWADWVGYEALLEELERHGIDRVEGDVLEIGALLGGAPPAAVAALGRLGAAMAHFVQVSDDLADALETPASADWGRGRGNLAILYAMTADHPERERFLALAARPGEPAALAEAQQILARSGAVAYCIYRMTVFAQEAQELLAAAPVPDPRPLERLLSRQRQPLSRLLAAAGADAVLEPARSV
jgi:geranylgeranyl diphosphate synthase type I